MDAGTLGLGGQTSGLVTVNTGTTLGPQGVLSANGGAVIDGTLSLAYDSLVIPRVPRITSSAGTSSPTHAFQAGPAAMPKPQ